MPPKPRKPSTKTSSRLLEVVRFLSLVSKDGGPINETHILLKDKTASAFNGTLGAGCIIEEDLYCAPHAKTFLNALAKCGENYSLTQVDQSKLSIKSGPFKAVIPCIDPSLIYFPTPDQNVAPIDDTLKEALTLIEKIKPENGQRIITLSFLMNGGSVIATDGKILVEAWHGLNLPTNVPIPKAIIPVLLSSKKLIGFGLSQTTATFYVDDNSFIRTQLYAERWPDISDILNKPSTPIPVPKDFFKGLEAIKDFSDNGMIYFKDGKLQSHDVDGKGAEFEVPEIKNGPVYSAKYLSLLKDMAEKIDFYVPADRKSMLLSFIGNKVRGILMGFG
jgi:hypothetical protein